MSIVRVNLPQAELLHTEYQHTATAVDDAISELSPLITQANAILDQASSPIYGPVPALQTTANGLRQDRNDLDWRLDYIERSERTHESLGTLTGYTPNLRPDSYLTRAEQDRIHHDNLATFRQAEAQSWTKVSTEPEPEPIPDTIYGYTPIPSAYSQRLQDQGQASTDRRIELGHDLPTEGPSTSTIGHVALDVGGMFPVVGNAADGANVIWYAAEQDYLNAALSSLAAIPAIGQAVTAAKPLILTAAADLVFHNIDEALFWARQWLEARGILRSADEAAEVVDDGLVALADEVHSSRVVPNGDVEDLISPQRRQHILDGDSTGGGHRYPGLDGKTPFPEAWTDEQILRNAADVATDPSALRRNVTGPEGSLVTRSGNPSRQEVFGYRDGVCMRVIVEPLGEGVITAHPIIGPCP